MVSRSILVLLGTSAIVSGLWMFSERSGGDRPSVDGSPSEIVSESLPDQANVRVASNYEGLEDSERALWFGATLSSSVAWENDPDVHTSVVTLTLRENAPENAWEGFPYTTSATWSTSYWVAEVIAGLGPNEFVLHGKARNGDDVFEHFAIDAQLGGYGYTPTVGGAGHSGIAVVGSAGYVPPNQRVQLPAPRRVELYRGSGLGAGLITAISPAANVLYVLSTESRRLLCIPRDPAYSAVEYLMGTDEDQLEFACGLRVLQHVSEGDKLRIEFCGPESTHLYGLLSDYDGDGYFDGHEMMGLDEYRQFGYPGLWVTDYVRDPQYYRPK